MEREVTDVHDVVEDVDTGCEDEQLTEHVIEEERKRQQGEDKTLDDVEVGDDGYKEIGEKDGEDGIKIHHDVAVTNDDVKTAEVDVEQKAVLEGTRSLEDVEYDHLYHVDKADDVQAVTHVYEKVEDDHLYDLEEIALDDEGEEVTTAEQKIEDKERISDVKEEDASTVDVKEVIMPDESVMCFSEFQKAVDVFAQEVITEHGEELIEIDTTVTTVQQEKPIQDDSEEVKKDVQSDLSTLPSPPTVKTTLPILRAAPSRKDRHLK